MTAVNVPHLKVIQSLDLARAGQLILTDTGFRDYDSLKVLDISLSYIEEFKPSWFSKKTIEVLNLSENFIKALKKDDMKYFSRLRIFNASFNEIKTIEANTFLETKKLEIVSLSHNQLTSVVFDNLENLKNLYLRGNQIATVSENSSMASDGFK
jgi:Leucine-rich repeat (LRR) protein